MIVNASTVKLFLREKKEIRNEDKRNELHSYTWVIVPASLDWLNESHHSRWSPVTSPPHFQFQIRAPPCRRISSPVVHRMVGDDERERGTSKWQNWGSAGPQAGRGNPTSRKNSFPLLNHRVEPAHSWSWSRVPNVSGRSGA